MSTKDFKRAAYLALDSISDWCPGYAQGIIKGDECWLCSPLRPDKSPDSFSINIETGLWHDFADNASGDALDLYCKITHQDILHAHDDLIRQAPTDYTGEVDLSSLLHQMDGPPTPGATARWRYDDGNGCSFWIVRTDKPGGKEVRPWHLKDGTWIMSKPIKPPQGYPLLNIDKLESASTIVIVEGEKACSAVPTPYVSTTWSGGASAVKLTNYAPLKGKKIILWPDNDEPGLKAMDEIKTILEGLGCAISIIKPDASWPAKSDAADFPAEVIPSIIDGAISISEPKKTQFQLTKYGDMTLEPADWLIRGILEDDSLGCVFGQSGHGKSYFVLDMAACIASGKDFHGAKVKRPGAVIYIAGEGRKGIAKRLRAWEILHKTSLKDAPIIVSHRPAALCDDQTMAYVSEAVRMAGEQYGRISLIIIDTWARNMAGNENDTSDTTKAIDALDSLRRLYNCSGLIVHHSGKGDNDTSRGSSALRAALDIEYKVTLKDGIVTAANTKMKDGEPPDAMHFALEYVDLGIKDEDGCNVESSAMTRIVIDDLPGTSGNRAGKGKVQEKIKQLLTDGPMLESALSETIKAEFSNAGYYKAKKNMVENGAIGVNDGMVCLL